MNMTANELVKSQRIAELENTLIKLKEKVQGKVFIKYNKNSISEHSGFFAKYYEDVFLKEGPSGSNISATGKSVVITFESFRVSSAKIHDFPFTHNPEILSDREVKDLITDPLKYISIDQFRIIYESIRTFSGALLGTIDVEAKQELCEYDKKKLEEFNKEIFNLDIPHVVLNENEIWLMPNCPYLLKSVYLLSPNSIRWAQNWLSEKKDALSFTKSLLNEDLKYLKKMNDNSTALYLKIIAEYQKRLNNYETVHT